MSNSSRKQFFLTRSEIFAAAWRRFRSVHGAKATPRQHPHYWAACLRMTWQAAKGDAFVLCAIRDDAREQARKSQHTNRPGRSLYRSYSRNDLKLIRNFTA